MSSVLENAPPPRPQIARPVGEARVVALLRAHVPLSLLMDLAGRDPRSEELYAMERAS